MTRFLILLELMSENVSYSPEGLRRTLNKLIGNEWLCDDNAFNAGLHGMCLDGLVNINDGVLGLTLKGKTLLRNSKLTAFIQGRLATLPRQ